MGNAGNISAIWKGITEFERAGFIKDTPMMTGIQAENSAPIANAIKAGTDEVVL